MAHVAIVRHYVGMEKPVLKFAGDEWDIAEDREHAEKLAEEINTLINIMQNPKVEELLNDALRAHGLKHEGHSQNSDCFRAGARWAANLLKK